MARTSSRGTGTGMGRAERETPETALFGADPAVVTGVRSAGIKDTRLLVQYETFVEEFSSILHRQAHLDEE